MNDKNKIITSKSKARKVIEAMHWKLSQALSHTREWDTYNDTIKEGEKAHRKGWCFGRSYAGSPVGVSSDHFANKHILQSLTGFTPKAEDIFCLRLECFQAYALVKAHRKAIRKAVGNNAKVQAYLEAIDYVALVA